ncbi:MAG: triose-phosphate isomerase [Candidatus Magasanikbacteria bacterium]|nr:triose-phosphate isomerase [Candidatus Magasanikbacteria bacterium]
MLTRKVLFINNYTMKYILANWKMYLNYEESVNLAKQIKSLDTEDNLIIFPSALAFKEIVSMGFETGAQNVSWAPQGAYTGALSAFLYKEVGAKYALVGHSERRYIFGENNEDVRKKVESCFDVGLTPVVCIGETKEDKDESKTQYRIKKQIMKVFDNLDIGNNKIIIAYEPVWAISHGGEGQPCTPADAEDVMGLIKREILEYTDNEIPILYGGSVDEKNVLSYVALEDCSGVLVGSASTKIDSFTEIIKELSDIN